MTEQILRVKSDEYHFASGKPVTGYCDDPNQIYYGMHFINGSPVTKTQYRAYELSSFHERISLRPTNSFLQDKVAKKGNVITLSGREVEQSKCGNYQGQWFELEKEAQITISGEVLPLDHPYLKFDWTTKKWVNIKKVPVVCGLVTNEKGKVTEGYFTAKRLMQCEDLPGNYIINESTAKLLLKTEDLIIIENTYYRKGSDNIFIDANTGEWQRKVPGVTVRGIVNKEGDMSLFNFNPYVNVFVEDKHIYFLNRSLALAEGFYENPNNESFSSLPVPYIGGNQQQLQNHTHFMYDKEAYKKLVRLSRNSISEEKPYKFGCEIELASGNLPRRFFSEFPFVLEYDGSLRDDNGNMYGGEIISTILEKDAGFRLLEGALQIMRQRCKINHRGSLHVHISGFSPTRLFANSIMALAFKVQDEIFQMLPASRSNFQINPEWKIKKNFCRKIEFTDSTIELYQAMIENAKDKETFQTIVSELSSRLQLDYLLVDDGSIPLFDKSLLKSFNRKTCKQPAQHKWNILRRYLWISLAGFYFGKPGTRTVEFRAHSSSLNYIKVESWIKICMGLIWYAEKYPMKCLDLSIPIMLEEVINKAYPCSHNRLNDYIERRKNKFAVDVTDTLRSQIESIKTEKSEYEKDEI